MRMTVGVRVRETQWSDSGSERQSGSERECGSERKSGHGQFLTGKSSSRAGAAPNEQPQERPPLLRGPLESCRFTCAARGPVYVMNNAPQARGADAPLLRGSVEAVETQKLN